MAHSKSFIAGIDEAGRGPLAGPVTVACVVFQDDLAPEGVRDSKELSEKQRNALAREIAKTALAYSIISIGPKRIDQINILQATRLGMSLAAYRVGQQLERRFGKCGLHLLIDGNCRIETCFSQETIVGGDATSPVIGAASILAKVRRDELMAVLDNKYPGYGFKKHKGYPTAKHRESLSVLGPSSVHRRSFSGVCPPQRIVPLESAS